MLKIISNLYTNIKKSLYEKKSYDKIINLPFKEINKYDLNCFRSNEFSYLLTPLRYHEYSEKKLDILKEIIQTRKSNEIIELDLKIIDSISASKSSEYKYKNIYEFGKNIVLERKNDWNLKECIEHIKNGLRNKEKIFEIDYYKWNNRYQWSNTDGSHHFAVANYITTNENIEYKIKCQITTYSINEDIKIIMNDYHIFLINSESRFYAHEIFLNNNTKTYSLNLNNQLILIQKNEKYKNIIELMKIIDNKYIFYLNDYIDEKLNFQYRQ
ncbi:DUF6685 family protein [Campylobacter fetus]|uniref:DUF6685 family protein n=1 Tax=Campylobacter fetus TaxID=196 RepID=UPI000818C66A|nr:DUF6685 family protein [Campylobacter fetus]